MFAKLRNNNIIQKNIRNFSSTGNPNTPNVSGGMDNNKMVKYGAGAALIAGGLYYYYTLQNKTSYQIAKGVKDTVDKIPTSK